MTKTRSIQPWRRAVGYIQALIIIGLPFLKIKGESALRFDIPSLSLYFFGLTLSMAEFFVVLVATIFLAFLIILATLMFGRVWCGWLCPQTVLIDFTPFADRAFKRGKAYKAASYAATFVISLFVAANLIWYFVSPYEFIPRVAMFTLGEITVWFWGVLTLIMFLNFVFFRRGFCSKVCPYAKLQSVLFDNRTLVISFDPERKDECMNCMACVRVCPVGTDIRKGMDIACVNCAECIDKCSEMMAKVHKKGLLGYRFGIKGGPGSLIRQNVVIIAFLSVFFLSFLLYLSVMRVPFDMSVLPNYNFVPRLSDGGGVVNSYILSIENRSRSRLELAVVIAEKNINARISPDRISLDAGEHRNVPVYTFIKGDWTGISKIQVTVSLESAQLGKYITKKATFIVPEDK